MGCIHSTSALMVAAEAGEVDTVADMIKEGGAYFDFDEINRTDGHGRTALFLAAAAGKVEVVKVLITNPNIDVNIKNEDGDTATVIAGVNRRKYYLII